MSYSVIASTGKVGLENATTTDAIDTSGSNLIVIGVGWYGGTTANVTVSDSKSNTWSGLTAAVHAANIRSRLFYSFTPTVGSGHTFTSSGSSTFAPVFVLALSGSVASPFDQENGATSSGGGNNQPGSVTPSEDNELLVTANACLEDIADMVINSGFTSIGWFDDVATSVGVGMAYKIQTSAGAENPTWSWTNNADSAGVIATFKAAGGGGGSAVPVFMNHYRQRRG